MLCFLKIGIIGFGGGAALIPVIENELVGKKKWIEKEAFDFFVVISSISPASLPVSLCAIWNNKFSLLSAYAYALPGPLLFLIIATGFSLIGEAGVRYIGFASVGIIVFILLILCSFIRKNYVQGAKTMKKQYLLVMVASFLLTSGNSVRRLLATLLPFQINGAAVFSISMMDLIFILFFMVFFISDSKRKFGIAALLSGLYALARGQISILNDWNLGLAAIMVILAVMSVLYDVVSKSDETNKTAFDYQPLKSLSLFLLIAAILTLATFLLSGHVGTWEFAVRVVGSALTSFGGGEAYISVADAVFVQSDLIAADIYYSQIIGIASAMPGPFIMSVVAGIGFVYGSNLGGFLWGWIFGLLGIALAVTATAFGSLILFACFEKFKESYRLLMIIKYIIPLVCGMLISISFTLLHQASLVLIHEGVRPWLSILILVTLFSLMLLLRKKIKINDIILLVVCSFGTLITLSIIF